MTARKENPQKASKNNPLVKPKRNPKSDTYLVKQITDVEFTGNVIPMEWFKHITIKTNKRTKPHLLAINILADVVYWYKGRKIRDERSGQVKRTEKKFKGFLLQRSYGQLANTFGVSKEQARTACHVLESHGLIYCHFRNIEENGKKLFNVMYIEPYPDKIKQITTGNPEEVYENSDTGSAGKPEEGSMGIPEEGLPENPKTYTETTNTENSITKNTNTETVSDEKKSETEQTKDPAPSLPDPAPFKITIGNFINTFIQRHSEFSPMRTKASRESADRMNMPFDDLDCEMRMEELINLAKMYDEIIWRSNELSTWYKNKGFLTAMPVTITYLTRKKKDIEDAFGSLPVMDYMDRANKEHNEYLSTLNAPKTSSQIIAEREAAGEVIDYSMIL